uniref:rab3 GTPase-activating protein non-catalytic subunit n=1 Tax=Erigeron canadensis TaxID=72917 RepID=UPI001CB8F7C0|nr:rab3 GTPase-activating protein non-catalytic subunit [Erigeron canadensis]
MSRKTNHLIDLGTISTVDLSELGAGKEAWLDNPNLICSLDTNCLAISSRYFILVIEWSHGSGNASFRVKIRPNLSPIEAEYISAVEWLVFDDIRVIAAGTSCGYLLIFSLSGDLIHKQLVYPERIIRLRVRGTKRDIAEDTSSFEEVCVIMPGIIARFDGSDIQRVLQQWYQDTQNRFWNQSSADRDPEESENSFARIPYQVWNVNKYGSCVDASVTGVMPPPLLELQSSDRYFCAITIGVDAVISAFRLSEDRSRSFVGAILSKVVPATFSTIASFSKLVWRSPPPTKKPEPKPQPFARALPLTCLKDHPRKGEKLTLSPSGTLAAITDSLGRIMLLDTRALVVVRLWKGYRDASCLFVERVVNKDSAGAHGRVKNDYCLCLAIHAPRKGIVEIWQMRTGPRVLTVPCPKGSKILQPTYRFGSTVSASSYKPLEVFLLNGDSGQLSRLN